MEFDPHAQRGTPGQERAPHTLQTQACLSLGSRQLRAPAFAPPPCFMTAFMGARVGPFSQLSIVCSETKEEQKQKKRALLKALRASSCFAEGFVPLLS